MVGLTPILYSPLNQWETVQWPIVEMEVGLIYTCLPAMRLILVRMAPRVSGSDENSSSACTALLPEEVFGVFRGILTNLRDLQCI